MCTFMYMYRPEVTIGVFLNHSQDFSETGPLPDLPRLAGQQAPGIRQCLVFQSWGYRCLSPCLAVGAGDLPQVPRLAWQAL